MVYVLAQHLLIFLQRVILATLALLLRRFFQAFFSEKYFEPIRRIKEHSVFHNKL